MPRALLMYHHGLGDVIMLTPCLRWLHQNGYTTTLMCRDAVKESHLLENCKYVQHLKIIENPWQSEIGFQEQVMENQKIFDDICGKYDWCGVSLHTDAKEGESKIDLTARELGIKLEDKSLEVFIPKKIEKEMRKYVKENYPEGFIFRHTDIEYHADHTWDASDWIANELHDLPIVNTGVGGNHYRRWRDINKTFALLHLARHVVLSSSVFVHASDALGKEIDVINYGVKDRKVWPVNQQKVKHIREKCKWIR